MNKKVESDRSMRFEYCNKLRRYFSFYLENSVFFSDFLGSSHYNML